MCDYSLEMYRSRPAIAGEDYETRRFHSGSVGFVARGDAETAICMACDMRLALSQIPMDLQQSLNIGDSADVTFVHIEAGPYHDGVRFSSGAEVTLQKLGVGVKANVIDALSQGPLPMTHGDAVTARSDDDMALV
jgi:hypothetical protein